MGILIRSAKTGLEKFRGLSCRTVHAGVPFRGCPLFFKEGAFDPAEVRLGYVEIGRNELGGDFFYDFRTFFFEPSVPVRCIPGEAVAAHFPVAQGQFRHAVDPKAELVVIFEMTEEILLAYSEQLHVAACPQAHERGLPECVALGRNNHGAADSETFRALCPLVADSVLADYSVQYEIYVAVYVVVADQGVIFFKGHPLSRADYPITDFFGRQVYGFSIQGFPEFSQFVCLLLVVHAMDDVVTQCNNVDSANITVLSVLCKHPPLLKNHIAPPTRVVQYDFHSNNILIGLSGNYYFLGFAVDQDDVDAFAEIESPDT